MRSLYESLCESLLDDEDEIVNAEVWPVAVKDWLENYVKDYRDRPVDFNQIELDKNKMTINFKSADVKIYAAPPKDTRKVSNDFGGFYIFFKLDEETSKKFTNIIYVEIYDGKLKDLTLDHPMQWLIIKGDVKEIKNFNIIYSDHGHDSIHFYDGIDVDFEDLAEIECDRNNPYFEILLPKTSKLWKTITKEYRKLGFEKFNEKYKKTLDKLNQNNISYIFMANNKGSFANSNYNLRRIEPHHFDNEYVGCWIADKDRKYYE